MVSKIEALVIDYCNVISPAFEGVWTQKAYDLLSSWGTVEDRDAFGAFTKDLEREWQIGSFDSKQFFEKLVGKYGIEYTSDREDAFFSQAYTCDDLRPREDVLAILEEQYKRIPVIVLSNSSDKQTQHMHHYLRPLYQVTSEGGLVESQGDHNQYVHAIVTSDFLQQKKSHVDGRMFEYALQVVKECLEKSFDRTLDDQRNIVFLDDREKNVTRGEEYFSSHLVGKDYLPVIKDCLGIE